MKNNRTLGISDLKIPNVSIVLPAYNEEKAIGKVIDHIVCAMQTTDFTYEIIVVDDCSQDKTVEVAAAKNVQLVRRTKRGGSGASRRTGILAARANIVVTLDADGSYEANDIPKLLAFFPEYDQVNGARTCETGSLKILRVLTKWLIRKLACYLTGVQIPDLNTGFKAFKKDVMMQYLQLLPDGFSCVTTMTLAFLANGYAVKYVPTKYYKRIGSSKFHPIKDTIACFKTVLRIASYFKLWRNTSMPASLLRVFGNAVTRFQFLPKRSRRSLAGFTLVEVAIMVTILGILAAVVIPRIISQSQRVSVGEAIQTLGALRKAQMARLDGAGSAAEAYLTIVDNINSTPWLQLGILPPGWSSNSVGSEAGSQVGSQTAGNNGIAGNADGPIYFDYACGADNCTATLAGNPSGGSPDIITLFSNGTYACDGGFENTGGIAGASCVYTGNSR